jgi:hypothetical protein
VGTIASVVVQAYLQLIVLLRTVVTSNKFNAPHVVLQSEICFLATCVSRVCAECNM